MRRYVGFGLAGTVALWLVMFLPPSASAMALALVVGVGAAGGIVARRRWDLLALAIGAMVGTGVSGVTQGLGTAGPDLAEVVNGTATVGVVFLVAGAIAFFLSSARRPAPPVERVGDDADG
ncbi:MAG: hypothetical protein AB1736_04205 [Chloroflexota bacterium]